MVQDYIPFLEIVSEIERIAARKATGTFFVATKANRSAQVIFDKGEIVFVYFYNKKGKEALELMLTIQAGRYRFQEGGSVSRRVSLPPTEEIVEFLSKKNDNMQSSPDDSKETAGGLVQNQKEVLERLLAEYIGPMAAIICEDYLDSAVDVDAAIDALAAEIPSAVQADKFRSQATTKIG